MGWDKINKVCFRFALANRDFYSCNQKIRLRIFAEKNCDDTFTADTSCNFTFSLLVLVAQDLGK